MKLMKFGGSSMANAKTIRQVAHIVLSAVKNEPICIVVSACQGVTNALLNCIEQAALGRKKFHTLYKAIAKQHLECLHELFAGKHRNIEAAGEKKLRALLSDLENLLEGVSLLREAAPSALDHIAGFGERLAAELFSSWLQCFHPAVCVDTRELIVTDDHFTAANVKNTETTRHIRHWQKRFTETHPDAIPVMTGFIAATEDGRSTTLGRNGSDYSAAIIGAALDVRIVEIWTDVDGVYSADPNLVDEAFVVPELSYEEAMELSHFGAKVLHPATLAPVRDREIPLLVKNTFRPEAEGTLISAVKKDSAHPSPASGITSIDDITLLSWIGRRRTEISTTVERLFRTLSEANINVFFISQASSQHSLSIAIRSCDAERAREVIREVFKAELKQRWIRLDEKADQMIVAIVGDGMRGVPGIAGKMFHSLGQQGISIRAIAQGASEHNISLVIDTKQKARALNLVHDAFFSGDKKLGLVLVGAGNVGSIFLNMLAEQMTTLRAKGFNIRLYAVANSRRMRIDPAGIDPAKGVALLNQTNKTETYNLDRLIDAARDADFLPLAFVDCTASSELVHRYSDIIRAGMHIVTPNKKANVLPMPAYRALMEEFRQHDRFFLYQTNVGAGLPVLSTLKDLLAGGDRIIRIEGVLSGTLSYLFNYYDGTKPFAEVLKQTQIDGLTEPDPREDLSGMDVARKLVIMAREIGLSMELKDVDIENLVPEELRTGKFSEHFYTRYAKFEKTMQKKLEHCKKNNCVLRYVGTLFEGKAKACLEAVPNNHPLAFTRASDNIIAMTTDRYQATPLVIQGLGAGGVVTAMGVFSDVLRLLHYLPY
ncbi:MAG: bifunctional aspartate kinase/homoserine dehydrogenase I [Gammaproteobacteria bacterium]|nr:bifunctional aspartate kinase/homoserine dehydrogenase I [Gammaproteobacteria bacterium]